MITPAQIENPASLTHLDLEKEIPRLKREMNAVILAHYWSGVGNSQDLADFVGDSLQALPASGGPPKRTSLSLQACCSWPKTAKILNPTKPVLLPDLKAGCSLADGCPAALFKAFRERHPDHVAITYINCSAEVKALSDIICNVEQCRENHPADSARAALFYSRRTNTSYVS